MANEKYESQDVLGSNEPSPYTAQSLEEDVDADGPEPLTRALESRHMQMIAIVSPSFPLLSPRTVKRNKLSNAQKSSVRAVLSVLVYLLVQAKPSSMETRRPFLSAIQWSGS
jgi:hypothetical protein